MELYKLKNSDSAIKLSFQGWLERACDSSGVSEGLAMWLLNFFVVESPAALLTICLKPKIDRVDYWEGRRGVEKRERIYVFVEAANYLLNFDATNNVVAIAITKIEAFKQRPGRTTMSFIEALKDKALRREDTFYEQQTMSIFVKGLTLNVRNIMRI